LQALGFIPFKGDTSLFFLSNKQVTMFVLVYVDDIIVASLCQEAINHLLKSLEKDFALKDLGDLHYFLGIEVTKIKDSIMLSQQKYAAELLQRAGMIGCKPVQTPLVHVREVVCSHRRTSGANRCNKLSKYSRRTAVLNPHQARYQLLC
jgi:hypothetical protein